MQLTNEQQLAVDEFKKINAAYDAASDILENIFKRDIIPLCRDKDFIGAIHLLQQMPESVAKMYCADYIRTARGDYE